MSLTITVTEKHIKRGKREDPTRCPIALALREMDRKAEVCVDDQYIDFGSETYRASKKAAAFITAFDAGNKVKPTVFRVKELLY